MKRRLVIAIVAAVVSGGNLAYAAATPAFAVCSDYTCTKRRDCENIIGLTCNYCSPLPFSGNKCLIISEEQ